MYKLAEAKTQAGFSLVELLLALALGLVVVTGIVQLFVSNTRTYEVLTAQARMQENARFALEFISQAARSAGYYGCSLDRTHYVNGLGGGTATNEWENLPAQFNISQAIQAEMIGGSLQLTFRGTQRPGFRLAQVLQPDEDPRIATPDGLGGLDDGDVVVLANCEQGALFRVTNVVPLGNEARLEHLPGSACDNNPSYTDIGNARCVWSLAGDLTNYSLSKLNRSYGVDSRVGALENTTFFLAPSADGNSALWQDVNGTANELVSGVENLEVLFGLDNDPGDDVRRASQYVEFGDLPDPGDLRNVVALRINITVNSIDAVTDDGRPLRRTYVKTLQLRNSNPEA